MQFCTTMNTLRTSIQYFKSLCKLNVYSGFYMQYKFYIKVVIKCLISCIVPFGKSSLGKNIYLEKVGKFYFFIIKRVHILFLICKYTIMPFTKNENTDCLRACSLNSFLITAFDVKQHQLQSTP